MKREPLIGIALCFCLMLLLASVPVYAQPAATKTIKIGAVYDITGPIAATGERFAWGAKKLLEGINKDGGLYVKEFDKKIPLQLVDADHSASVDKAALQAEYVNQQDVVAIIATTAFLPAGGAVAQKYSLPCFMTLSNNKTPYEVGNKYLFSNWPKTDDNARTFFAFLNSFPKEQRPTTIALFEGMHDIGVEFAKFGEREAVANEYKFTRVKFEWFTKDLSTAILEAKRANAEAVFGIMHTPVAMLLVKQMKELDFNPKAVFLDMGPTNPMAWATLGKDGDYMCCNVEFSKGVKWPGAKEFIAMHRAERPKDGDYFEHAAAGYAAAQVISDAIKRASSLDREKIRNAIAATNMTTIIGPTKFRADGTMELQYTTIVQYQDKAQTIIFPEKRREKAPVYPMPKWKER